MKTTTNFFLIFIVANILIAGIADADLTITPTDKTTNSITWGWDSPSNVSEMYIDGHLMCGYESTEPSVNVIDLRSGSCHNLTLFSDIGNGTNVTCALWGNVSLGGGGESYGNAGGASMNNDAIMYGLVGACVGAVVLMGFFMKRRR
jgi:hypothetical protein